MPVRILLADNCHEGTAKSALNGDGNMVVIDEARDAATLLTLAPIMKPDIVIMDMGLPGMEGRQLVAALKKKVPDTKIVILSCSEKYGEIRRMLYAGSDSFIGKDSTGQELVRAVRETANGGHYFSQEVLKNVIKDYIGKETKTSENI